MIKKINFLTQPIVLRYLMAAAPRPKRRNCYSNPFGSNSGSGSTDAMTKIQIQISFRTNLDGECSARISFDFWEWRFLFSSGTSSVSGLESYSVAKFRSWCDFEWSQSVHRHLRPKKSPLKFSKGLVFFIANVQSNWFWIKNFDFCPCPLKPSMGHEANWALWGLPPCLRAISTSINPRLSLPLAPLDRKPQVNLRLQAFNVLPFGQKRQANVRLATSG